MLRTSKHLLLNFVVLIFSLIFSLGIAELAVRFLKIAPQTYLVSHNIFQLSENSELGYELKPNSSWTYENISYDINEQGTRGPVHSSKKPDNTFRIALIGDSITFGLWVSYEASFANQLSELLNQHPDSSFTYEVVNFGVSGYTTKQISYSIDVANEIDPDLIIYGYCMNDPQKYSGEFEKLKRLNGIEETRLRKFKQALFKSALFRSFYYTFFYDDQEMQQLKDHANEITTQDNPQFKAMENNAELQYLSNLHQGEGLERLRRATEKIASDKDTVLVVIFPSFPVDAIKSNYLFNALHTTIRTNFEDYGIKTFDLLEHYQHAANTSVGVLHQDKIHPNAAGHLVAANAIFDYLKTNTELP